MTQYRKACLQYCLLLLFFASGALPAFAQTEFDGIVQRAKNDGAGN
jgi:hypothetical protein